MLRTSSSQLSATTSAASSPGSENSGASSCSCYGARSPVQPRSLRFLTDDGLTLRLAGQRLPVLFRRHDGRDERGTLGPIADHDLEPLGGGAHIKPASHIPKRTFEIRQ